MGYTLEQYQQKFSDIISEKLSEDDAKKFLIELNESGFSKDAFLAAINVFRPLCKKISAPQNAIDVCGTGGDKLNTLNVSTAVALTVAACGIPVAKHGNKAVSSKSGSADVLSELGINIMANPQKIEESLLKHNLCFMFAPLYHESFRKIAKIRADLATEIHAPTIFNFLGPLLNPASTKFQLIGTSRRETMIPMLEALRDSGSQKVFIVHGLDGMDEITICNNSAIVKLEDGEITDEEIINPEDYGIKKVHLSKIEGKDAKYNAGEILKLLDGKYSSYQDIVVLNSAFALLLAGKVSCIFDGIIMAENAIHKGLVKENFNKIINNK